MAYGADIIETNGYGGILVGELVEYIDAYERINNGLYPNTTVVPTVIYYDDILPKLQNVNTDAYQQWEAFSELSFNSMDDVVEALSSDRFNKIVTDIAWIFGAPDVGGLGVARTGADSYSVVYINGYTAKGDTVRPLCNSLNITNPHGITINNTIPETYGGPDSDISNIQSPGTYKTGICFVTNGTYDKNNNSVVFNEPYLRFNAMAVFTDCHENYYTPEYQKATATFRTTGEGLAANWTHNFINTMPRFSFALDPVWREAKSIQWSFGAYYPYWGLIPLNVNNIEGTSIFGGESAVLDTEGNPYEVYDPYGGIPGGGGGPQDRYSENTLPEGHPSLNLLNSGFVKLYNPTFSEVHQFASFLFSGITEDMAAVIKRIMVNPIDYILALNMIHIPLTTTTASDIGFCGISSGVSAAVVTEQYYEIEYSLDIREFWCTALDYSSYTKCKIYVPYCGIYEISIDEIQNGTLWLRYVVDVVSGSVVAFVGTKRTQKDGTVLRATMYQYNGNCILSMPVSQTNWQNTFSSVLNIASMAIAPSPTSVAGMAQNIMSQKVSLQKSGSISANFGYLGKQIPYVILERPELSIPVDYGHHEGYPANHKRKMSEVHGYTEVKENTLIYNKFSGTDEEMEMLKSVLESGVYLD